MKILFEKNEIPFQASLAISHNAKAIDSAIEKYLSEKSSLDQKYMENDPQKRSVDQGKEEEYLKQLTELNDKVSDIPIEYISISHLNNICFPPKFIGAISFMLKNSETR